MSSSVWGNEKTRFFDQLKPEKILNAIDHLNFSTTGRLDALASMENRVYEVEIDNPKAQHISENFLIAKFYRPGRWSKEQIQDEHDFLFDLMENEIPVIAPKKIDGISLFENEDGLYFALFPKMGGRACDEYHDDLLAQMGRLLARLHNTGRVSPATHRLTLNTQNFGKNNLAIILNSHHLPLEYQSRYQKTCEDIFSLIDPLFKSITNHRIHGDCHHGNILLNQGRPFLIDFDDMSMGPAVQDIWLCIPGRDEYSIQQREKLIQAYSTMADFDWAQLKLIEPLRALRIIHFSAWISLRFEDHSFQRAFSNFGQIQYWEQEIQQLNDIASHIAKPSYP